MISADHRRERWSSVRSSFGIRYFGTFRYPVRLVVSSTVRYSAQCSGFSSWMRFSHSIRQSSPFSFVFNFLIFVMSDECVERRGIFDEYCQWNPQIVSRRDTNQKEDHDGRWREDKPMMGERRARRAMERWRSERRAERRSQKQYIKNVCRNLNDEVGRFPVFVCAISSMAAFQ